MTTVTTNELNLLIELKEYTEIYFSADYPMWIYIQSMQSDMKKNRGLISSLMKKGIIAFDSGEEKNDIIEVKKQYWLQNDKFETSFVNLEI